MSKLYNLFMYVPLLLWVVGVYFLCVFGFNVDFNGSRHLFTSPLPSAVEWSMTASELFIAILIPVMFLEIVKATNVRRFVFVEHVFSLLLAVACVVLFIVVPQAGTATFLIITLLAFLDVAGGITISIRAARRDFSLGA